MKDGLEGQIKSITANSHSSLYTNLRVSVPIGVFKQQLKTNTSHPRFRTITTSWKFRVNEHGHNNYHINLHNIYSDIMSCKYTVIMLNEIIAKWR